MYKHLKIKNYYLIGCLKCDLKPVCKIFIGKNGRVRGIK